MKWWYWLILEVLIIFGLIAWIYFFPSEIEGDFSKGLVGFALINAIEEYKNINRRKTMDYKDGAEFGYNKAKKACDETQELLDKQIEATYKLDKENEELKEKLTYAKAIMRELLDNSNEYTRQNAENFIKE